MQIQARRFLCRHYYPEGGWGWVVAVCAVLVHVLNHGVQLSCSQLVEPAAFKFQVAAVYPAGIYLLFRLTPEARVGINAKAALFILPLAVYSQAYYRCAAGLRLRTRIVAVHYIRLCTKR